MSKFDEDESVEQVGEPVSRVLNDTDPEKSWLLTNPTLTFIGCMRPIGQPSSYNQINQKKKIYEINIFFQKIDKNEQWTLQ